MKLRTLLAFLLTIVAGLQQVKAQEAYVCRTPGTLTFYYDNLRSSREEEAIKTYDLPADGSTPSWWQDDWSQFYIENVVFDPSFARARPTSTYRWFMDLYGLRTITGIENLNTSAVTDMGAMFCECTHLTSLDLSHFNTAKVTNMNVMFYECTSLTSLNLSSFNTAKVTYMNGMFSGCKALTSLNLSSFNTANVKSVNSMFYGCEALTSLNLSSFNTAKVYDMESMFRNCSNLKTIYVSDAWSTAGMPNYNSSYYMFANCTSLVGGYGTRYNPDHVDHLYARVDRPGIPGYFTYDGEAYVCYTPSNTTLTFYCDNQRSSRSGTIYDLNTGTNIPGWIVDGNYINVTRVVFDSTFDHAIPTTTYSWFSGMYKPQTITGMEYLNTSEVTNMSNMFRECNGLYELDLSNFNTAKATDMSYMFYECHNLSGLELSSFNTSKVTDMSYMFYDCHSLSELDLSNFNTAKVTNMTRMFSDDFDLKYIFVGNGWSTAAVTSSDNMFLDCYSLIGRQNTGYDENHVDASYAHIDEGTSNPGYLNYLDEPEAYVAYSRVFNTLTFYFDDRRRLRDNKTYSLNTGDESPDWRKSDGPYADIVGVGFTSSFAQARPTSTNSWFAGMTNLQSISGLKYLNTCEVTNMHSMFSRCNLLTTINVSNFNTDKVTDMGYMFYECKAVTSLDLSNFKTAQVTDMSRMFFNCNSVETIYVGGGWSTQAVTNSNNMFYRCLNLVGDEGTTFDTNHIDASYAHIDGGTSNPGYLTAKIKGDVNLDKTVDIADAVSVLNAMAGQTVAGDANVNGDFDANGNPVIDIADLVTVLNIMAGQ